METNLPDAYALLLARLVALEAELAALRERMDELDDERDRETAKTALMRDYYGGRECLWEYERMIQKTRSIWKIYKQ